MGIFKKSPQDLERAAYRKILAKQTAQVERQAYAEEAKRQAALRAKQKAIAAYTPKPSMFGQVVRGIVNNAVTPRKVASVRSPTRKVVTYKKKGKRYVKQVRYVKSAARQVKQQMATPAPKPQGLNLGYSGSFYN